MDEKLGTYIQTQVQEGADGNNNVISSTSLNSTDPVNQSYSVTKKRKRRKRKPKQRMLNVTPEDQVKVKTEIQPYKKTKKTDELNKHNPPVKGVFPIDIPYKFPPYSAPLIETHPLRFAQFSPTWPYNEFHGSTMPPYFHPPLLNISQRPPLFPTPFFDPVRLPLRISDTHSNHLDLPMVNQGYFGIPGPNYHHIPQPQMNFLSRMPFEIGMTNNFMFNNVLQLQFANGLTGPNIGSTPRINPAFLFKNGPPSGFGASNAHSVMANSFSDSVTQHAPINDFIPFFHPPGLGNPVLPFLPPYQ